MPETYPPRGWPITQLSGLPPANANFFAVTRSFRDQLVRADLIDAETLAQVDKFVDRAERFRSGPQAIAARAQLRALAGELVGAQYDALRESLIALADA